MVQKRRGRFASRLSQRVLGGRMSIAYARPVERDDMDAAVARNTKSNVVVTVEEDIDKYEGGGYLSADEKKSTSSTGSAPKSILTTAAAKEDDKEKNIKVPSTLNNRAFILLSQGEYEKAYKLLRKAKKRSSIRSNPVKVASILQNIGEIKRVQDKYDDAVQSYFEALDIYFEKLMNEQDGFHEELYDVLAHLRDQTKFRMTIAKYEAIVQNDDMIFAKLEDDCPRCLNRLATVLSERDGVFDNERSLVCNSFALAICQQKYGDDDPFVSDILQDMALSFEVLGEGLKQAYTLIKRAEKIRQECYGGKHPDTMETKVIRRRLGRKVNKVRFDLPELKDTDEEHLGPFIQGLSDEELKQRCYSSDTENEEVEDGDEEDDFDEDDSDVEEMLRLQERVQRKVDEHRRKFAENDDSDGFFF